MPIVKTIHHYTTNKTNKKRTVKQVYKPGTFTINEHYIGYHFFSDITSPSGDLVGPDGNETWYGQNDAGSQVTMGYKTTYNSIIQANYKLTGIAELVPALRRAPSTVINMSIIWTSPPTLKAESMDITSWLQARTGNYSLIPFPDDASVTRSAAVADGGVIGGHLRVIQVQSWKSVTYVPHGVRGNGRNL